MSRVIANLRIWQKSLLPIVLLAIISGGITLYLSAAMSQSEVRYAALLDSAKARLATARTNVALMDTARISWRTLGVPATEGKRKVAAELPGAKDQFNERLGQARAGIEDPALLATLTGIERNYAIVFSAGTESAQLSIDGDQTAAVRVMVEKFAPAFAPAESDLHSVVEKLVQSVARSTAAQSASKPGSAAASSPTQASNRSPRMKTASARVCCM